MRIRTIKPEFWDSESLGRCSREARLLFIGLWSLADDSGITRASSRFLASRIFPYDNLPESQISAWLEELDREGCVRLYSANGDSYLDIPNWLKHQRIDHPTKSKLPQFANPRESSRILAKNSSGSGNREQGKEVQERKKERSSEPSAPPLHSSSDDGDFSLIAEEPEKNNGLIHPLAEVVLAKFNSICKRECRATKDRLSSISARLKEEGVTVEGVEQMLNRQVAVWGRDVKMAKYLTIETLFRPTKFPKYYDSRNLPTDATIPIDHEKGF